MAVQPRMGMPPPGQQIGQPAGQQTIVLGRPGQQGSSVVTAGGQIVRQQFVPPGGGIRVQGPGLGVRPATHVPTVAGGGGNVVINQPGSRPGQPGSQITVPLQALQGLQPGQGIPTGQAGHLLVKTDNGQYQILRVGGTTNATASPTTAITSSQAMQHPSGIRTSTPGQLPTQPLPQQMSASIAANVISTQSGLRPQVHTMAPPRTLGVGPPATVVTSTPSHRQSAPPVTSAQASVTNSSRPAAGGGGGMGGQMTPDTAKMKCKNFLATLLRLAGEQPQDVANNVRSLIQGLIDGKVEPEIFTTRLQKELNSSPQPCLVPFLKKSLPYLQNSLASGELSIEGVRAPPISSLRMPGTAPGQLLQGAGTVGVRPAMSLPRPPTSNVIYQTSTRPPASVIRPRGQSPVTTTVVRPSLTQSPLPLTQLQNPVANRTKHVLSPNISSPSLVNKGLNKYQPMPTRLPTTPLLPIPMTGKFPNPTFATKTLIQPPLGQPYGQSPKLSVSFSSLVPTPPSSLTTSSKLTTPTLSSTLSSASLQGSSSAPTLKYPDKKSSASYSASGDEDINDVAAMGGVNLAEETQRMAATDLIGNQVLRSCKDETFLQTGLLTERISRICRDRGLDAPPTEVVALVSHATQERLKTLLEKLSVVAEHRLDIVKATDEGEKYEVTQDVRGQLKFLNDLEKIERKRHDEAERELLFRAAKSRTKTEDPEKEKLKAKAKEMQRLEEEVLRHEKANNTARLAIGLPMKRRKLDGTEYGPGPSNAISSSGLSSAGGNLGGFSGSAGLGNRPRTKRVHLRDLLFLMEQEKELKRSPLLWKSYSS